MQRYNHKIIEKKWQSRWEKSGTYEPDLKKAKRPFYNLMMFPYPSAEGLHAGNMYTFTGVDTYGRFKRLQGYDVFEPIGLDGFGIHSENYAIKVGDHPAKSAQKTEKRFYAQLKSIGNSFAWDERLETYDPNYYRWTQWLFVTLFKAGLVDRKKAPVNWCPSCKTVLADEQVIKGRCERCNHEVIQKELEQWFFKIATGERPNGKKYCQALLENIDQLNWTPKIKIAQSNWIGKSSGIIIDYPVIEKGLTLSCFTTRPDTNFGATFLVIAPEHPLVLDLTQKDKLAEVKKYIQLSKQKTNIERISEGKKKTGVFTGSYVLNRLNNKKLPIWIGDFVLSQVGTGAVIGVPGHDAGDFEFAFKFHLPIVRVVVSSDKDTSQITKLQQVQEENGTMVNSEFLNGMEIHQAKEKMMDFMESKKWGKRIVTYRLRDWLVSRQRYWGPPIPMIYCHHCALQKIGERPELPGWYCVLESDLPVKLPHLADFQPKGKGKSPLATLPDFVNTVCPHCHQKAQRETDVSDTFVDSSWYFLRYPSLKSKDSQLHLLSPEITKKWLPVNMYIGGAEHAVLHLLYARFITMALYDLKVIKFEEPFARFFAHGLIIKDGAKMSKSKGNIVNPDVYIDKFGADVMRIYFRFLGPFEQGGDFRDAGIAGITRFLDRVWQYTHSAIKNQVSLDHPDIQTAIHKTINSVAKDYEALSFNTVVSSLMTFVNLWQMHLDQISLPTVQSFLLLLCPLAPYISEELWENTGGKFSIHNELFPKHDPKYLQTANNKIIVQVNGKLRGELTVPKSSSKETIIQSAKSLENVSKFLKKCFIQKEIVIPGKLINFVTKASK